MEKILTDKDIIKILAHGDNHTGSSTGLLSPNSAEFDGEVLTPHPQNNMQRWLWRNYISDLTTLGELDVIINNGDNIEGTQMKIMGRTLQVSDIDVQKTWSAKCLQLSIDICKPKFYIGVTGTNYHIRLAGNCNADISIYKALEQANPNVKFIYGDNLIVQIGKLNWSIAHPYPTTQYKTPPIEKLIAQHAEEFYYGNTPKINVFDRGHAHGFIWERLRDGAYGFVTPCQQPTSAYGREKAYMTVRHPDIGILGITQEGKDLVPRPLLHKWRP
jgi:hypothetical protein